MLQVVVVVVGGGGTRRATTGGTTTTGLPRPRRGVRTHDLSPDRFVDAGPVSSLAIILGLTLPVVVQMVRNRRRTISGNNNDSNKGFSSSSSSSRRLPDLPTDSPGYRPPLVVKGNNSNNNNNNNNNNNKEQSNSATTVDSTRKSAVGGLELPEGPSENEKPAAIRERGEQPNGRFFSRVAAAPAK